MALKLRDWLFDRATVGPETFQALNKGLPKGVGWLNALGSTALTLIVIQVITGMILAMYYSPHPNAAYETIRYIDDVLPMGRLVHGLHSYGSSAVVVVVALHLIRTYFHGAYKPPRELIWLLGVLIFNVVLAFGFTGYLLPWDQKAYFATQVGTQIPAGIPLVGPIIQQLMRGGQDLGALTITRFYSIHVLVLPAALLLLLSAHVILIWRKGPTAPGTRVGEKAPYVSRFVDHQLFKDATAMFVAFGIVFLLSNLQPVEVEFKANPADPTYHPRPEWYFLFLFKFLDRFGKIPVIGNIPEWIPAAVLPGVAMTFLALAPWIDRSPERSASKRPVMTGLMVLGLAGVVGFTIYAYMTMEPNATPRNSLYGHFTDSGEKPLDPELVNRGRQAFGKNCAFCHKAYHDYTTGQQPDLTGEGFKTLLSEVPGHPEVLPMPFYQRFVKYVRGDIRPVRNGQPATGMPGFSRDTLSDADLEAIGAYLSQDPAEVAARAGKVAAQ